MLFSFSIKKAGSKGEDMACTFLRRRGYRILSRNVRNDRGYAVGEIDIVAQLEKRLVFVEVKTRVMRDKEVLPPEMSITRDKLAKLERAIASYRKKYPERSQLPYQLDAVIVELDEQGKKKDIRHLQNIFL